MQKRRISSPLISMPDVSTACRPGLVVVRTFVPFVAGAAQMTRTSFVFYNFTGGAIWVAACFGAGYAFGNVPVIKNNFSLVTIAIVIVSVLPMVIEYLRHRRARGGGGPVGPTG